MTGIHKQPDPFLQFKQGQETHANAPFKRPIGMGILVSPSPGGRVRARNGRWMPGGGAKVADQGATGIMGKWP